MMKRKFFVVILALACLLVLAGCQCEHDWVEANCVTPKTCSLCEEIEGAPLGHTWVAATCEEAKYCQVCDTVEGEPAGHVWVEASCAAPKHCENCDLTEGETLEHTWLNATTEAPKTCSECGATEGERIITDERFKTEESKALFGSWQMEMTMSGEELDMGDYVEEVPFLATLTFSEDGNISMDMGFQDLDAFMEDLHTGTVEAMYQQFEELDMTREEADTAFLDTYGMSVEDYCTSLWAMVNWDAVFDIYEIGFVYYVEGDQIYVADNWDAEFSSSTYSVNGDQMTLTDSALSGGTTLELTKLP